ncbi:MAG: DNA mismatch repair protein MutT, partial [Acidobacteria bacterium]
MLPLKHSVAVMIVRRDQILAVRRPEDDDELPGIWGLPAATLRGGETVEDVIARIGRDKLGVKLTPVRL